MSEHVFLSSLPHAKTSEVVLRELHVTAEAGLTSHEAAARRRLGGANVLPTQPSATALRIFFSRFRDTLILLLLLAAATSAYLGHAADAIIILIAVGLDIVLSFWQSWRVEKTLALMRQRVPDIAHVTRGGKLITIPAHELVVGDILQLRAGRHVPCDSRLLSVRALRTHEAALTGEASDVAKSVGHVPERSAISSRHNMVFAGTSVTAGSGTAVVTAIGSQTEFGKIAAVIRGQTSPHTPLRQSLQQTGVIIGVGAAFLVACLIAIYVASGHSFAEAVRLGITLIVSAIPEDLTMILTIALTVGVLRISRQGGIVRQLSAAETLGSATVVCLDKTGTLTEGVMRPERFDFLQGETIEPNDTNHDHIDELTLTGLVLANDAYRSQGGHVHDDSQYFGSATEKCALQFAENLGISQKDLKHKWRLLHAIPFSSTWKYRAVVAAHPTQASNYLFVVGAPEVLLNVSSKVVGEAKEFTHLSSTTRAAMGEKFERFGSNANRLLAVAVKRHITTSHITHKDVQGLTFLGVLIIQDPVRKEVAQAVAQTQAAGVSVKIITGDHKSTALAVARQVGLPTGADRVATSEEISAMADDELSSALNRFTVLARIEPLDKQRIVRLLQEQGHVVAMTGDGINDAVALKGADLGVAMGSGSDVAKDAADLVLLNNSFSTIVTAIKEGRVLRDNVRKVMAYLLSTNMAEVLIFFACILLGLPVPLTAAQILWINLVTSGTSDIALSLEGEEEDVMRRGPEHPKSFLLGAFIGKTITYAGLIMTLASVFVFWLTLRYLGQPIEMARTVIFAFLATTALLSVWSFRSQRRTLFSAYQYNHWIILSAGFSFVLQLAAMYIPAIAQFFGTVPLGLTPWLWIVGGALATVIVIDMRKLLWPAPTRHSTSSW
ncbi:MAG: cation-transporting P-type ATPase [Candidatus Andersenbacteria bacterium]|nr:cation-transporting P-type ATPase [Candidatus Andersenbacteria bacterium]